VTKPQSAFDTAEARIGTTIIAAAIEVFD